MIVSANQPYFAPYTGFFQKALRSDMMVILDSVQFPRGSTWIVRNRFKNDQGAFWLTVPVHRHHRGLQQIRSVQVCHEGRWSFKLLKSLQHAYGHAPYFEDHQEVFQGALAQSRDSIVEIDLILIRYLLRQLDIDTRLVLQSHLGIDVSGKRLYPEICRRLGAAVFLAQRPAAKYIQADELRHAGVRLQLFNPVSVVYPQLWGRFIPNLSAFDLVFNCGPKARDIIRRS